MSRLTSGQSPSRRFQLASETITTAGTVFSGTITDLVGATYLAAQSVFTYGSGGTNCTAYIQTSLDSATTWVDLAAPQFTTSTATKTATVTATGGTVLVTPTDGSLTANTAINTVLGDRLRAKIVSTGTYAGSTTLVIECVTKGG